MTFLPKVLRSYYSKLKQGDLPTYARSVLNKMRSNARYDNLASILTELQAAIEAFEVALAAAKNNGKQEIAAKNLAKKTLIATMNKLADGIEFYGGTDMSYYFDAGVVLQKKPIRHEGVKLEIPINFIAKSNGQPGGVQVKYDIVATQKSLVKMVGYEWSLDKQNWNNGDYGTRKKFDVSDMPSNEKIYVRIKAIGTDGRVSKPTEPVITSVL